MLFESTRTRTPEELARAIEEYFEALEIGHRLEAAQVVAFLEKMTASGTTPRGLEAAWTDIELFCAYLEAHPASRRLDELEPWEFSRFVFEFLETEVYDPQCHEGHRKRQLLSTVAAMLGFLAGSGHLRSSSQVEQALREIFGGGEPRRVPRPPMRAGERIGWLIGTNTGMSHPITAADLWLSLICIADFGDDWNKLIVHLETHAIPAAEKKSEAAKRLESIRKQDDQDPVDLLSGESPGTEMIERARRFFYKEDGALEGAAGPAEEKPS